MSSINYGKARQILNKSFVENHENINEDSAGDLIVKAELKIKGLLDEQANDDKLNAAKQIVKDLNSGYNSAVKYERAKIAFLLGKIEEIQDGSVNPSSGANP